MSLASKIALGGSLVFTVCTVTYVNWSQFTQRGTLREGVIKDIQRQALKKSQNIKVLQDQIELTKILEVQRDKDLRENKELNK